MHGKSYHSEAIEKLEKKQLIETKDVIQHELEHEKRLKKSSLKEFRLAFIIANEAIDIELVKRQFNRGKEIKK